MAVDQLDASEIYTIFENIFGVVFLIAVIVLVVRVIFKDLFARTVTVRAKVVDKEANTYNRVSNLPTHGTTTDYVVAFYTGARTLRFKTSVFVFDSVNIGDEGTLKFNGDRIISFE